MLGSVINCLYMYIDSLDSFLWCMLCRVYIHYHNSLNCSMHVQQLTMCLHLYIDRRHLCNVAMLCRVYIHYHNSLNCSMHAQQLTMCLHLYIDRRHLCNVACRHTANTCMYIQISCVYMSVCCGGDVLVEACTRNEIIVDITSAKCSHTVH